MISPWASDAAQQVADSNFSNASGPDRYRSRILLAIVAFVLVYAVIGGRLVAMALQEPAEVVYRAHLNEEVSNSRPDILDRKGRLLATDIRVPSLYAEPHQILDVDEAIELLTAALPDLDPVMLRKRLSSGRHFAWIKRELTPAQRDRVHDLGIPGIGFIEETKRIYPAGRLTAHVLGHVDVDNRGIAGIEKYLDREGLAELHDLGFAQQDDLQPRTLTIDLTVQHAVRDELARAMTRFKAIAAGGVVINAKTGEVVAMVSLPDYNPYFPAESLNKDAINRITTGVYELGSVIKAFTTAMAIDAGVANLDTRYDARSPIRVGSAVIDDYHAQRRILTVPEVFIHSSNIGAARMALAVGIEGHQEFLARMGFHKRLETELPETSSPLFPSHWTKLSSMTISFGHGFAISPMQAVAAGAALVNGGRLMTPTFFPRTPTEAMMASHSVLRPETSDAIRYLMRLNVVDGTARGAEVPGFFVGGKTGTAEKVVNGVYSKTKVLTTFLAAFPMDNPEYVMLTMLDEPKGLPETHGYHTSGWNIVPTTGQIIKRIAPLLGVERLHDRELEALRTASARS